MSQPPLRFVHASDFHLELPLGGVSEVPSHLRELFLEAPFQAAHQVFDIAVTEGATRHRAASRAVSATRPARH